MPQLFQVLKCYECSVFQVHQVKKSNKWQCKLCGKKQSLKRRYGIGTGKECRLHVQKLNGIRGDIDELNDFIELNKTSDEENEMLEENCTYINKRNAQKNIESKWSSFVNKPDLAPTSECTEKMFLGATEVVLEVPVKKRKKFVAPITQKDTAIVNKSAASTEPEYYQPLINETFCKPDILFENKTFKELDAVKKKYNVPFSTLATLAENKSNILVTGPGPHAPSSDFSDKKENKVQSRIPHQSYIPPKVNKNSKWAQFTNEPDEDESIASISKENSLENIPLSIEKSSKNEHNHLFTLCDDNELDSVLDF